MNTSWLISRYCNVRHFMKTLTINKRRSKVCKNSHKQIGLYTKGSFHENGQCNYIKILIFFIKVYINITYKYISIPTRPRKQ